ncbi:LuxR C-terminal-related transcriptional regulator [Streptosporangium sp. NBC_01639]|uniref:helix-turn-helix transcriptional regulator n=1 Tax=Streptosporangium sp. NBC_01639 TaxID=2975948 RepID=UPI00386FB7A9|nr:LuxR C-terminal-related transcriptional regulator [Streptosporangium sp. NBC_01639]
MLYGRSTEQAEIEVLVTAALEGRSGVLVVRGEAGIGKTALLDWAAGTAAGHGLRVVRVTGVEQEADLAFGGLTQLLWPLQDRLDALPGPQAAALKTVLGAESAGGRDRFLTGLAVLTLLADLAEDVPVLCLVDDAQWLDQASAEPLLFAARRLAAEGVAMVFATREDGFAAPGLGELRPSRLDGRDSARLLAEHQVAPVRREKIIAESAGNPLALIEFAAGQRGQSAEPLFPQVADRVLASFRVQIGRLPERTRLMMLMAAAEGRGDLALVLRAAHLMGTGLADLEEAERAGLIQVTESAVVFRHPLIATAAYQGTVSSRRVAVHRALVEVAEDPDCRAHHLPAATMEPDAGVASELAAAAERAGARTAYTAAARLYEQAARLAVTGQDQVGWLARAAAAALSGGRPDQAAELAERAEDIAGPSAGGSARSGPPPEGEHHDAVAELTSVRAAAMFELGEEEKAVRLLLDRADRAAPRQGGAMLRTGATYAWFAGDEAAVSAAARKLAALGEPDQMAEGLAHLMRADYARGLPLLTDFLARTPDTERALFTGMIIGNDATTMALAAAEVARCREQGLIGALPQVLQILAQTQVWAGLHREAEAAVAEAAGIACDSGLQQRIAWLNGVPARIAAIEGDESRCRRLVGEAPGAYQATGDAILSLLELSMGDHESALDRLEAAWSGPGRNAAVLLSSAPDQIEAAVRLAQPHRAEQPLRRLRAWAQASAQPWVQAVALRCQALTSDDETSFQAALTLHEQSGRPFEHARTQLLYGEWLRRARRPGDAGAPLHAALETFTRLDAAPWITRARSELHASGETPRTAHPSPTAPAAPLTPRELHVVRLAAAGRSSREIAAQLFLSPRTVEYHLYKAYPKLGVTSRRELSRLNLP